ncbi:isoleucyl-tRNA synthetase [Anopheles sinensis]|uniref:Isoleucyl-tRNA synthetase n=1 Tax=Anopheles sinensis TaxID=74873 RepID=A0A084VU28_ANOSI|nr:isoleucyl-tRNA synthetase [Anopheles sinensis]
MSVEPLVRDDAGCLQYPSSSPSRGDPLRERPIDVCVARCERMKQLTEEPVRARPGSLRTGRFGAW